MYKLIQGDCLEKITEITNESISLVFSSPPYNIGKVYEKNDISLETYLTFQKKVILMLCKTIKPGGSICWQVGNYVKNGEIIPLDLKMHEFFIEGGMCFQKRFIWSYGHGLHCQNRFSGRYETITWYTKGETYSINIPNNMEFLNEEWNKGLLNIPNVKSNHVEKTSHPCQFPIELVQRFIVTLTRPNDIIMDPFCGVASTVIAAILLGRIGIGIELSPEYIKIAETRIGKAVTNTLEIRNMNTEIYTPKHSLSIRPESWKHITNPSLLKELEYNGQFQDKVSLIVCNNNITDIFFSEISHLSDINICIILSADTNINILSIMNEFSLRNRMVVWTHSQIGFSYIYWFTKGNNYKFDLDAVRVPAKYPGKKSTSTGEYSGNPLGKNPSDVWCDCCGLCPTIYQQIGKCHFERLIRAFSSPGDSVIIFSPKHSELDICNKRKIIQKIV